MPGRTVAVISPVRLFDHFHPAHADGLYTHTPNAVIRQKVVGYDGKGRISPEDRNPGT
jgi:hypothetical protein